MLKKLIALAFAALIFTCAPPVDTAWAQGASGDISDTLARLKNNPRYAGRVLGTHLRRDGGSYLYEVRILRRRDDRVILVYIDPETGGVVGDSEKSARRPVLRDDRRKADRNKEERKKRLATPDRGRGKGDSRLGIRGN